MLKLSRNGIKANFQTQGLPIKNNKRTGMVNKGYRLSQLGNSALIPGFLTGWISVHFEGLFKHKTPHQTWDMLV